MGNVKHIIKATYASGRVILIGECSINNVSAIYFLVFDSVIIKSRFKDFVFIGKIVSVLQNLEKHFGRIFFVTILLSFIDFIV